MSVRDEARYQPGDSVGTIGNDREYHGSALNIDGDFQVRKNILFPMQFRGSLEQKWWQLFGKYWLVKNQFNDDDCKKMNWLLTGGNHATVDMSGENFTMHCDSIYCKYQQDLPGINRLKYVGCGRLINSHSIDTPARLLNWN